MRDFKKEVLDIINEKSIEYNILSGSYIIKLNIIKDYHGELVGCDFTRSYDGHTYRYKGLLLKITSIISSYMHESLSMNEMVEAYHQIGLNNKSESCEFVVNVNNNLTISTFNERDLFMSAAISMINMYEYDTLPSPKVFTRKYTIKFEEVFGPSLFFEKYSTPISNAITFFGRERFKDAFRDFGVGRLAMVHKSYN